MSTSKKRSIYRYVSIIENRMKKVKNLVKELNEKSKDEDVDELMIELIYCREEIAKIQQRTHELTSRKKSYKEIYADINEEIKEYLEDHRDGKQWKHLSIFDEYMVLEVWELNESFFEQQMMIGNSLPSDYDQGDFVTLAMNNDFVTVITLKGTGFVIFENKENLKEFFESYPEMEVL